MLEELRSARATTGPQCEASTLTEYQQRNNVARVVGHGQHLELPGRERRAASRSSRASGTTPARSRPIEFNETWQRADAEDHRFNADYPIGDNVELMSVRVRGLTCTCAEPAQ